MEPKLKMTEELLARSPLVVRKHGPVSGHLLHLEDGRVALRLEAVGVEEKPWYWAEMTGWVSVSEENKHALDAWHAATFPKE